tara:strand:- start:443 stop:772 length:330 start_codon:yes stop_codon:yes gene_type:complete
MALTDDRFKQFDNNLESPAKYAVEITPGGGETPLALPVRALYIGCGADIDATTANVHVRLVGNTADPGNTSSIGANTLFVKVSVGSVLPVRVATVHAEKTTAQHIVGLL